MIHHDDAIEEEYADLFDPASTPAIKRVVRALDALASPPASPHAARLDMAMARLLHSRSSPSRPVAPVSSSSTQRRAGSGRLPLTAWAGRPSLLLRGVAALIVVVSAIAGYLHSTAPIPASAQIVRILHRAEAALHLDPGQAAHFTYTVSVLIPGGQADTGTADVWVQTGANGAPTMSAQTLAMGKSSGRYIQIGRQVYAYDPGRDTIRLPATSEDPGWLAPTDAFDAASVTQELTTLAQRSPQHVHLRPRQRAIAGHAVNVIEVDGWIDRPAQRTTFYFDAQSDVLRGFDATGSDPSYPTPSWQARLTGYATLPATTVPPHTFTLNPPATARVEALPPDKAALAATCKGTDLAAAQRAGHSLLAACQAGIPTLTTDGLLSKLTAADKAALDAAVATGQITPAQAAGALAELKARLMIWVTAPAGSSASPNKYSPGK